MMFTLRICRVGYTLNYGEIITADLERTSWLLAFGYANLVPTKIRVIL